MQSSSICETAQYRLLLCLLTPSLSDLTHDGFHNYPHLLLTPLGAGIEQLTYERDVTIEIGFLIILSLWAKVPLWTLFIELDVEFTIPTLAFQVNEELHKLLP